MSVKLSKCTKKKYRYCKKNKKTCNNTTGRCINPNNLKKKVNRLVYKSKCTLNKYRACRIKRKLCNPDTGFCKNPLQGQLVSRCTTLKNKKCRTKGKKCNPDTGFCKNPLQGQIVSRCTTLKNKECRTKGKKCNPETGLCNKKEKKSKNMIMKLANFFYDKQSPITKTHNIKSNKPFCKKDKIRACNQEGRICNKKTGRCKNPVISKSYITNTHRQTTKNPTVLKHKKCNIERINNCLNQGRYCNLETGRCKKRDISNKKTNKKTNKKCTLERINKCWKQNLICHQNTGKCINSSFKNTVSKIKSRSSPTRKIQTRKSPTRKIQTRKSPTRKTQTRKSPTRKTQTRKSPTRKTQTRKSPTRKTQTRKSPTSRIPIIMSLSSNDSSLSSNDSSLSSNDSSLSSNDSSLSSNDSSLSSNDSSLSSNNKKKVGFHSPIVNLDTTGESTIINNISTLNPIKPHQQPKQKKTKIKLVYKNIGDANSTSRGIGNVMSQLNDSITKQPLVY